MMPALASTWTVHEFAGSHIAKGFADRVSWTDLTLWEERVTLRLKVRSLS
jgi:hypothetical protein